MKLMNKRTCRQFLSFSLLILLILPIFQAMIFSSESPEDSLREKLKEELSKEAQVVIDVKRMTEGDDAILQGNVTNISSSPLQNLTINGMVFKDNHECGFHYSVVDIFEEQKVFIAHLNPNEIHQFEMLIPGINWDGFHLHGVVFVQAEQGTAKEILQAVYIE